VSATLRYLSYVRRGLARSIGAEADASGLPRSAVAAVEVTVTAAGEPIGRTMAVRGPGSVVGLAADEVLRVDPLDGTRDHATNLFPSVELRTADLPWLFTPARPRDDRLVPWLVLVVVEERDGVELEDGARVLSVDDPSRELPDLSAAWAWAHVQVYADYTDLAALLADTPELATARLLCPRSLEPDTSYLACVVPSFEAGRLAGLGLEPPADPVALAWTADSSDLRLPVFHSWSFRTAPDPADFEELVRRLEPRPLAADVGVHDLDISDPGSTRLPNEPVTVGYEGALGSPEMEVPRWRDPERGEFRSAMGDLLEDAAPGAPRAEGEPYVAARHDPVVSPPRYGALPAGIDRIPEPEEPRSPEAPRWLSEANLDPKYRSAAGLGADVVRRNQEALMADAWDQALGVGQVNGVLNRTRLALCVGQRSHARLEALPDGALLQVTAGAHARLPGGVSGRTVLGRRPDTTLPAGLVSAAFRRRTRAGSVLAKAVTSTTREQAVVTGRMTERFADVPELMFGHATLTVPFGTDRSPVEVEVDLDFLADSGARKVEAARLAQPAFREVDSVFGPLEHDVSGLGAAVLLTGDLELGQLAAIVREQLEPTALLAARLRELIEPADALGDEPVPGAFRVSPELRQSLYRKLVSIDPELLMPGVGSLPADSVGLAVINEASVEAFLLGANHEFSRELAWREYPADLGGTWLRTFWDSGGAAEDIPPVDAWMTGPLGTHAATGAGQMLVLVIKGQLLRRYPSTLVTAVPARWAGTERKEDTRADALDPIFSGTLGPDAVFLGFEFDATDDVAGTTDNQSLPGWYFAFEEPPTEPAFGLDTEASDEATGLEFWKDLTWADARVSPTDTHVSLESLGSTTLPYDEQDGNDWEETWAQSAAGMARITLQRPVRMLVHADQMLVATDVGASA
jgi:hypothetical protein